MEEETEEVDRLVPGENVGVTGGNFMLDKIFLWLQTFL